jgi:hypothetical protein
MAQIGLGSPWAQASNFANPARNGSAPHGSSDVFHAVSEAIENHEMLTLYVLYGDFEGGQRVITQFATRWGNDKWRLAVGRRFNVDRPDPRPVNGHPA